jgi:branched-subunit amino acid aminotransferase/4-amino-4-deoxychorismate lyase
MGGGRDENAGWCVVDGVLKPLREAAVPVDDPAVTLGWAVFETLVAGHPAARVEAHLRRLARSAAAAAIGPVDPAVLAAEIDLAVGRLALPARVRITLTGGGRRLVAASALDLARRHRPVRAVRGVHLDDPVLHGDVKHTSRASWAVAVRRSGVDEVLLVDADGRFTEGTSSAIAAVIDGVLWTAPHDGRILESTTLCEVVDRADRLGIPVRREGPPAAGPWDGLYVCSTTRDIAPVVALDGVGLPGWDSIGRALADAAPA